MLAFGFDSLGLPVILAVTAAGKASMRPLVSTDQHATLILRKREQRAG